MTPEQHTDYTFLAARTVPGCVQPDIVIQEQEAVSEQERACLLLLLFLLLLLKWNLFVSLPWSLVVNNADVGSRHAQRRRVQGWSIMTMTANWVANGASLEDCHSNIFSLVRYYTGKTHTTRAESEQQGGRGKSRSGGPF
ncbi:hypothetical protein WMY93_020685 [Mugilogobius chulae]|uniref:Uncharacterized protein n=1 Tax=Mugilogobius chulae TaxID=88201 RepID=A0AAW0NBQ9_9GOBI